jgi:peptidoglycan/xylan/chitin deacetylase (PgdA/CDA1 family)
VKATLGRQVRRLWRVLRSRGRARHETVRRLVVTKTKWLRDADSPVVLMVDDLTNAWHNRQGAASWEAGGDWGGGLDSPDAALAFLENGLLRDFPEVRATFFVVAGAISAYTHHQPFSYAAPLDATEASRRFFRTLQADARFELAYHGYNHGTAGATTPEFVQEWRGFPSRAAAIEQTRLGLQIFRNATCHAPRGGKYGGWDYNEFGEDAVSDLGFLWWCRDWMPRDVSGAISDGYYEPAFFGGNLVVALPSTVHGHFWQRRQIDVLLARRQIISIEEHIATVRPDGLVQTPNIVDDLNELRRLYRYLRSKNVWHANCSDVAAYVVARENVIVYDVTLDGFSIRHTGSLERSHLTLRLDCSALCCARQRYIEVTTPDGRILAPDAYQFDERHYRHRVTVPVISGHYGLRPAATQY